MHGDRKKSDCHAINLKAKHRLKSSIDLRATVTWVGKNLGGGDEMEVA